MQYNIILHNVFFNFNIASHYAPQNPFAFTNKRAPGKIHFDPTLFITIRHFSTVSQNKEPIILKIIRQ